MPPFLPELPDVRCEVTQYWNSVRRCDQCFGQIMASLHASGEAACTAVAFIGDHGMAFPFAKTTLYVSGTRTPLMIRYPGLPEAAINTRDFVSNVDMMPTLLQILRVPAPAGMDGRSLLLPLIEGQAQEGRDHVFTWINTIHGGVPIRALCAAPRSLTCGTYGQMEKTKFRNESMGGLTFNAMSAAAENDPQLAERVQHFLFGRRKSSMTCKTIRGKSAISSATPRSRTGSK